MNLLSNWRVGDSGLLQVGDQTGKQFLALGIILIVISLILVTMFAVYFGNFKKSQSEAKIMNSGKAITTFALPVISTIIGVFLILFYAIPGKIFGDNATDAIFGAYLGMSIPGYILAFVSIVLMWIWIPQYGISFDKEKVSFVGDYIPYSKIVNFGKDEEAGKVYINYTNNKRHLKKQAYPLGSVFGQFLLANAELTGKEVVSLNEKEFINEFESTENFVEKTIKEATKNEGKVVVDEVIVEEAVTKTAPKKPAVKKTTTSSKPKAKSTSTSAKPRTTTAKQKSTSSKAVSSTSKIGRKIPEPKPIVYVAPTEISISAHKIPKYTDKK